MEQFISGLLDSQNNIQLHLEGYLIKTPDILELPEEEHKDEGKYIRKTKVAFVKNGTVTFEWNGQKWPELEEQYLWLIQLL